MINKNFLNPEFKIKKLSDIEPFFKEILQCEISDKETLENLIKTVGELYEKIEEDYAWTYINMTRDTNNEEYQKAYKFFSNEISPQYEKYAFEINKKIINSGFADKIDKYLERIIVKMHNSIDLFREENLPIKTDIRNLTTEYQKIAASLTVKIDGKEYTLIKAAKFLKDKDREKRKTAFDAVCKVRMENREKINNLLDKMLTLRKTIAKNAGFDNYRDYRFKELDRTDYTVDDCRSFHNSIKKSAVPIYKKFMKIKAETLGIEKIKPYDKVAPSKDDKDLVPYKEIDELINKTIKIFSDIKPLFGETIAKMKDLKLLDLENRKGKAPGGYNYPLLKTGLPFIFMNAIKVHSDMRVLMHEGGHAVHSVAAKDQFPFFYRFTPSEVAELASMSMELLTMDKWNEFYKDEIMLKQAKKEQLEGIITIFPWICIIDEFQHWLYEHYNHTASERETAFDNIILSYGEDIIDWSGYDDYRKILWQKQSHLFSSPFYYIEYAFAQLGALQVWKNYRENGDKAIDDYFKALSLGASESIPNTYKTAGIKFDFSEQTTGELMEFLFEEYKKLL